MPQLSDLVSGSNLNFDSNTSHQALGRTVWLGQSVLLTAACLALCVGLVTKTVLMAQQCSTHCSAGLAQHQGLYSHSVTPENEAGVGKRLGGDAAGTAEPS